MKRVNLKSQKVIIDQNGIKVQGWSKECPCCHKTYETTSRTQKFCSTECAKVYNSKKRSQKRLYDQNKPIIRLSARSHSLATEVVNQLIALNLIEPHCSCGATENLQVHHIDLNWLNNTPSNLQLLCPKCHAEAHAKLEAELKSQGKTLSDFYNDSIKPFLSVLNKNV